jgi:hypothetical protein
MNEVRAMIARMDELALEIEQPGALEAAHIGHDQLTGSEPRQ